MRTRAAWRLGFFFICVALAGCGDRDPASIARAADARAGSGIFTWLAEHDPSAIVVFGIDAATTRAVAPDARVSIATSVTDGCKRALHGHALLALLARVGNRDRDRDRADDCGFALFRDNMTMVIAPR